MIVLLQIIMYLNLVAMMLNIIRSLKKFNDLGPLDFLMIIIGIIAWVFGMWAISTIS